MLLYNIWYTVRRWALGDAGLFILYISPFGTENLKIDISGSKNIILLIVA